MRTERARRAALALALTCNLHAGASSALAERRGATTEAAKPAASVRTGPPPSGAAQTPASQMPAPTPAPTPAPEPTQSPEAPQAAPDSRAEPLPTPELGRVGVNPSAQRPLSLREAMEMALANNKEILVESQDVRLAEVDLRAARGAYEPRFSSSTFYERSKVPVASFLSGGVNGAVTQADVSGAFRVEGLAPRYGGNYRLDLTTARVTTNNLFASLTPQYYSGLAFGFTQPLARGLRFDDTRRQIEIARRNLSLTDAQFRQRAIEVVTAVQHAYWDLVFALRNLQIQREAARDAREQLEHNRRLVERGRMAPIDVVATETQVANLEQSIYGALEGVSRAENRLKEQIAAGEGDALWGASIIPTDPAELSPPPTTLEEAIAEAKENRPELQQAEAARQFNGVETRYWREQTKPQVDLVGSYGTTGLAGSLVNNLSANPLTASIVELQSRVNSLSQLNGLPAVSLPLERQPLPDFLLGGYGQSVANLALNRFNNFRVGVQVNFPWRDRTAEARLSRALIEGERVEAQRERLLLAIQADVRNSLQAVRTAESRLRAAAFARASSEKQYESERRRERAGHSTLFLVLERQTALTAARGNELRAQTDLNKAIADLHLSTGRVLQANSITVKALRR